MSGTEWLAVFAVVACALAVLPGTLGILMLTNRVAADERGARLIYRHSRILLWLSIAAMLLAWVQQLRGAGAAQILFAATVVYAGILAFGFLMHTRLMFQPVRAPKFITVDRALAEFGPDEEVVGAIDPAGEPWAFVARLARRPHIVHQPRGDTPFMMTHCILSHSSMAYENSGAFAHPEIMITAAIANNMVFYDAKNRCSVTQLHNGSRDGSLPLKPLPTLMMSLGSWARLHPESRVWIRDRTWRDTFYLKVLARADVIDPASPVLVYPLMHERDERLPLKSLVLGVESNGAERAYPLSTLDDGALINDELGGEPLLLVSGFGGDYAQVFSRRVGSGSDLSFRASDSPDRLIDVQTQSTWNLKGECIEGPHRGARLRPIPHYNKIFWFAWADYHPATEVYAPPRAVSGRAA